MKSRRLDEVSVFDDRLSFLIPHEWTEAESDDEGAYLYHLPDTGSGWFRVSLVTRKGVLNPEEHLKKLFSCHDGVETCEVDGKLVRRAEKQVIENGKEIRIYYWFVGGALPPDVVCEAVFSYTALGSRKNDPETHAEVELLDQLVRQARFHRPQDTQRCQ